MLQLYRENYCRKLFNFALTDNVQSEFSSLPLWNTLPFWSILNEPLKILQLEFGIRIFLNHLKRLNITLYPLIVHMYLRIIFWTRLNFEMTLWFQKVLRRLLTQLDFGPLVSIPTRFMLLTLKLEVKKSNNYITLFYKISWHSELFMTMFCFYENLYSSKIMLEGQEE